uniref:Vacuolar iron transporter n=1 Tax=Nelumbo nucifera TaxID=4432 RepID=A0A822ZWW7_NELNU|nr:TPA_asm: hypothetical protein HUJ06_017968 [Nelumbo nucifera]
MDDSNSAHLIPLQDESGKQGGERPKEPWSEHTVKSIVYAGLDAIVTCFSLISSISSVHYSSVDVLVLGFANLVANGISMGFADFISTGTKKDAIEEERLVTEWDVNNQGRQQQMELMQRYQQLGMSLEDATTVVNVFSKYKDILIDEKMTTQKGMQSPNNEEKAWQNGVVTLAAFLAFGCAPLLPFVVLIPFTWSERVKFLGACVVSALALALLGIAKARIAGRSYAFSTAVTLLNGAIAAASAYLIGWLLRDVAGLED